MLNKKKPRLNDPINAGSMADIAFLLLIFFLVTATIAEDQGIYVKLPPWDDQIVIDYIPTKNVLSVHINAANELLVEGELTALNGLRAITKEFISNPQQDSNKPTRPKNAIVSIINDRGTNYATYLAVYNEIKAAYNELWESAAQKDYGTPFENLSTTARRNIQNEIPLVISEADPVDLDQ